MRNATNSLNFSGWENFDPAIRNYNPQSTRINTYFRTRISGLNTSTSGIEWSSDIPPLIPGDGQVMKSWTTLQNPSSFTAGTTPRAELEAHDYIKQLGWSVYDPAIPQTRAYSFAFRLPTNFTYSTIGGVVLERSATMGTIGLFLNGMTMVARSHLPMPYTCEERISYFARKSITIGTPS